MRVFVTGIEGVLGTVLAKELRARGHEVFGCDLRHSADPNVVRADVSNSRQLCEALDHFHGPLWERSYDLFFNFAAEFGRKNGEDFFEDLWRTNMIGNQNVINECIIRDIVMVFESSSEAYGLSEIYNNGEALREEMLDQFVPSFHNQYSLSKWANERQIHTAVRNEGLGAIILRFFNVYGPPEHFSPYRSVVCQFAWKLLNGLPLTVNREGKRSHLWIGDWANTVANIAQEDRLKRLFNGQVWPGAGGTPNVPVFNIGGTEYETVEHLYYLLKEIVSEIPQVPFSDVTFIDSELANSATKQPDNTQAIRYLDHNPVMPFEEGLEETVARLWEIRERLNG